MLLTLLLTAAATNVNFMADSFHGRTYHFLPPTKEEVNAFVRVNLSVCLSVSLSVLARLLKNACTDLYEMLRVDRCRDMDELINF